MEIIIVYTSQVCFVFMPLLNERRDKAMQRVTTPSITSIQDAGSSKNRGNQTHVLVVHHHKKKNLSYIHSRIFLVSICSRPERNHGIQ